MKNKSQTLKNNHQLSNTLKWCLYAAIAIYFSVFFLRQANFSGIDLGRHITNGKITVTEHKIVQDNYYSYTEPNYQTINHHWLTGVVFYLVQKVFDFKGLSIFYLLIHLITLFLLIKTAELKSDTRLIILFAALLSPIMTYRHEIRPEGFSYLFMAITMFIISKFNKGDFSYKKTLIILVINQLLWVNFHIFFFMQFIILGAWLFDEFVNNKNSEKLKRIAIFIGSSILVSLLNPKGLQGLLVPLTIFDKYGYMVAENMNLFFMIDRFPETYIPAMILVVMVLLIMIVSFAKKIALKNIYYILLLIFFSALTLKAVRSLSLLGYISLVSLPILLTLLIPNTIKKFLNPLGYITFSLIILSFIVDPTLKYSNEQKQKRNILAMIPPPYWRPHNYYFGAGLMKNQSKAGEFFVRNNLKGPIFNNYDIGSYLIYYLHDKEKVFVDNRPEAYSVAFFDSIYNPAIEKEEKWFALENKYNFNYIFFYRHDNTTHAQPFLLRRIADTTWIPVFVDDYNIIIAKNNTANKPIIDRYAISKDIFQSVPGK